MPCDCQAKIMAELASIKGMLALVVPVVVAPAEPDPVPPLVRALGDVFGHSCFTASRAWQRATDDANRAAARGEPEPELSAALRHLGIETTRSLGHHLSRCEAEGAGIRRGGPEHNTNTWEVLAWARRG